jgi:hypothetical protein
MQKLILIAVLTIISMAISTIKLPTSANAQYVSEYLDILFPQIILAI